MEARRSNPGAACFICSEACGTEVIPAFYPMVFNRNGLRSAGDAEMPFLCKEQGRVDEAIQIWIVSLSIFSTGKKSLGCKSIDFLAASSSKTEVKNKNPREAGLVMLLLI